MIHQCHHNTAEEKWPVSIYSRGAGAAPTSRLQMKNMRRGDGDSTNVSGGEEEGSLTFWVILQEEVEVAELAE